MRLFKRKSPPLQSVLFVCTGNVTRSPVAAAMFRRLADASGERWEVGSAGTGTVKGSPPNPVVAFVMFGRGTPIQQHRSRPVTRRLLDRYYWIMVMERSHREKLLEIAPEAGERVQVLRRFGRRELPLPELDMPDPTGKEVDDYRELFDILDEEVPRLFKALQNRVSDLGWEVQD